MSFYTHSCSIWATWHIWRILIPLEEPPHLTADFGAAVTPMCCSKRLVIETTIGIDVQVFELWIELSRGLVCPYWILYCTGYCTVYWVLETLNTEYCTVKKILGTGGLHRKYWWFPKHQNVHTAVPKLIDSLFNETKSLKSCAHERIANIEQCCKIRF